MIESAIRLQKILILVKFTKYFDLHKFIRRLGFTIIFNRNAIAKPIKNSPTAAFFLYLFLKNALTRLLIVNKLFDKSLEIFIELLIKIIERPLIIFFL